MEKKEFLFSFWKGCSRNSSWWNPSYIENVCKGLEREINQTPVTVIMISSNTQPLISYSDVSFSFRFSMVLNIPEKNYVLWLCINLLLKIKINTHLIHFWHNKFISPLIINALFNSTPFLDLLCVQRISNLTDSKSNCLLHPYSLKNSHCKYIPWHSQ